MQALEVARRSRRPTRPRCGSASMPPSALLAMVGPKVASHVLHTLHAAYPDRFRSRRRCRGWPTASCRRSRRHGPPERGRDPRADPRGPRGRGEAHPRRGRRQRRPRSTRACSSAPAIRSSAAASRSTSTRPACRSASPGGRSATPDSTPTEDSASLQGAVTPARERRPGELPPSNGSGRTGRRVSRLLRKCRNPPPFQNRSSRAASGLEGAAHRAERWFGEPFLHPGEEADVALAPGTARRRALDDALEEITAGQKTPSAGWKGALRADARARARARSESATASRNRAPPTPDRRARRDAHRADRGHAAERRGERQRLRERQRRGLVDEQEDEDEEDVELLDEGPTPRSSSGRTPARRAATASATRPRPGRRSPRRGSSRARGTSAILILTHRRLLVDQFRRDLTTEGYGDRLTDAIERRGAASRRPITIQTYAWFARHSDELSRTAYQLVICDEAHTALGEKTSNAIRRFPEPLYIGMTATEQLIAKQVSGRLPRLRRRPP